MNAHGKSWVELVVFYTLWFYVIYVPFDRCDEIGHFADKEKCMDSVVATIDYVTISYRSDMLIVLQHVDEILIQMLQLD